MGGGTMAAKAKANEDGNEEPDHTGGGRTKGD